MEKYTVPFRGSRPHIGWGNRMRRSSSFILGLYLFLTVISARGQQQNPYYVYNGTTLRVVDEGFAPAKYNHWQIWLYREGARIPQYAAGLQYSRWGLIEGGSAESVIKELRDAQSFEEVYVTFFGPGTWGRYTFSNPLGPIAVSDRPIENETAYLEAPYRLAEVRGRVNRLIVNAQPSLKNNHSEGPSSPHREYFDQIRDALQQVSKLYSLLARSPEQGHYASEEITRIGKVVRQAENDLPKITASLPTVKLPTDTTWMFQTERAGSDGTIQVEVTERGAGASVQQTWTGGDGSMAGTVTVTTIPFDDIGKVELRPGMEEGDKTWTVFVQSGRSFFPEMTTSPLRKTLKRVLPAVNLTSERSFVYFAFRNPTEAQDAYAYFLYHQELGR